MTNFAKRIRKSVNHATRKWDELEAEMEQNPDPTREQLIDFITRMNEIGQLEGMTVKGAKRQQKRGLDYFGEVYATWDVDQQTMVWDEVHRMVKEKHSAEDGDTLDLADVYLKGTDQKVTFTTVDDKGNPLAEPFASFGGSDEEAQMKGIRRAIQARMLGKVQ